MSAVQLSAPPKATAPPAELAGLGELWQRLRGGAYPTFTAGRPVYAGFHDDKVLRDWPGEQLAPLDTIRRVSWNPGDEPGTTIDSLSSRMRSQRPLLAAVLFSPDEVLCRLRQARAADGKGVVDAWIGMCWTAEAAWRAVTENVPEPASGDAALLRPLAARLRFLVLSEPMRWRGERDVAWWGWTPDRQFGGAGIVGRVFGPDSWRLLVSRCRDARRDWQDCLDAYQSHPLLSQAAPHELEQELAALIFRHGYRRHFRRAGAPLGISTRPVDQAGPLTTEDRAFLADVADRHLLPRFALLTVVRLGLFDDSRRWQRAKRIGGAAVAATGAAAVGYAMALDIHIATILAAVCYLLICTGVAVFPPQWGAMWLLRMPAASAVGIIALVSLLPGGWVRTPPRGWLAAGALAAVSFGYLLVEARNHGVARGTSVLRSAFVAVMGAVHALLVSLIGMVVVAPAFVGDGKALLGIWHQPGYGHAGMVLALAAAWCLAVGVFSQILWNDQPITATLAHLRWRR